MTGREHQATQAFEGGSHAPLTKGIHLSIALVTRNRPQILERCLDSWRLQTVAPAEIVISDDSDSQFVEAVKQLALRFGCLYTSGPKRGLYANRNHAALSCTGTHVLTDDDDHTHPSDYVEQVLKAISSDPQRIWIFAERSMNLYPDDPMHCPPELHRSGHGCQPKDPTDCTAIADGSSVYPRQVFDSGLRYDETYRFGTLWYLWGKVLVKHGWRISYCESTFVRHYEDLSDRVSDIDFLAQQLECMTYVLFVNAFWINRSLTNLFWACAYLIRRILFDDSVVFFTVKTRLDCRSAFRLLQLAWTYPQRMSTVNTAGELAAR